MLEPITKPEFPPRDVRAERIRFVDELINSRRFSREAMHLSGGMLAYEEMPTPQWEALHVTIVQRDEALAQSRFWKNLATMAFIFAMLAVGLVVLFAKEGWL